jgi:hypothetical protein
MITELTPEQEAQFPVYRKKWTDIGLCTDPIDFEKSVNALKLVYEKGKATFPKNIHYARGPLEGLAIAKQYKPGLSNSEILNSVIFGNHDAGFLSFYSFLRDVLNVEACHDLDGLIELAEHSCWVIVYEDFAIIHDRPLTIKMDENNRLHSEVGPSLLYRDGFEVYSWHGVRIPKDWIVNKQNLTAEKALKVFNMEQRKAACEIVGWIKILRDLKAVVIDEDEPMIGTLIEVTLPDSDVKDRFLKVLCGTNREFALAVPRTMKTALEANAWTYDIPSDFVKMLEVRT